VGTKKDHRSPNIFSLNALLNGALDRFNAQLAARRGLDSENDDERVEPLMEARKLVEEYRDKILPD